MTKRARVVLSLPLALAACTAPEPYSGEVPTGPPHAERGFGEPAKVTTTAIGSGVPVEWEVTVSKPVLVDATYSCFPVTLTPTFIGDYPVDVTVTVPTITPVADDQNANFVQDASVCGNADTLSGYLGDLKVGREVHTFVASWTGDGVPATGVRVDTDHQRVSWGETRG